MQTALTWMEIVAVCLCVACSPQSARPAPTDPQAPKSRPPAKQCGLTLSDSLLVGDSKTRFFHLRSCEQASCSHCTFMTDMPTEARRCGFRPHDCVSEQRLERARTQREVQRQRAKNEEQARELGKDELRQQREERELTSKIAALERKLAANERTGTRERQALRSAIKVQDDAARKLATFRRTGCNHDHDCVFAPHSRCACPPCGVMKHRAISRKYAARLGREDAHMSCPELTCRRCTEPVRWLGSKAVCVKGRCAVR